MASLTSEGVEHIKLGRGIGAETGVSERFEKVVGRPPTRTEYRWVRDGWIPGSLL